MVASDREGAGDGGMDAVCGFIADFIAQEFAARRAVFLSRTNAEFNEYVKAVNSFFDVSHALAFHEARATLDENDPDEAGLRDEMLERLRPRVLFLVRRYQSPSLGSIYRCYLDSGMFEPKRYYGCYFVARLEVGWRIVAHWLVCLTCAGSGQCGGTECPRCSGTGWDTLDTPPLGNLGSVLEVRRFVPPSEDGSREDYESDSPAT
jgi:hypothetical protein